MKISAIMPDRGESMAMPVFGLYKFPCIGSKLWPVLGQESLSDGTVTGGTKRLYNVSTPMLAVSRPFLFLCLFLCFAQFSLSGACRCAFCVSCDASCKPKYGCFFLVCVFELYVGSGYNLWLFLLLRLEF
jgi:hypothetical protein